MKPETAIQINMADMLSQLARQYEFFFFSVPNEGFMESVSAKSEVVTGGAVVRRVIHALLATLKKMGLTPGIPDLVIIWRGRAYFIEVKTPTSGLTGSQPIVHERLRACGCQVAVCRSVKELLEQLEEWGIAA